MLINSMLYGRTLKFVTILSLCFVISNISIAIGTLIFNVFQEDVIEGKFSFAQQESIPFNIVMCFFVWGLTVPHWVFFFTYFECCTTMPYFYMHKPVPKWVSRSLSSFNVAMLTA